MAKILIEFEIESEKVEIFKLDSEKRTKIMDYDIKQHEIVLKRIFSIDEKITIIGGMIFKVAAQLSKKGASQDYFKSIESKANQEILRCAKLNNPDAQYILYTEFLSKSLIEKKIELLEEAESWLYKAARNGSHEAKEVIEKEWNNDKSKYQKYISKD